MKHNRTRGAASVEAVVILPVLIILLASVYYVRNQSLARMAAESKARTCAWAYSNNHCDTVPDGCAEFVHEARAGGAVSREVTDKLTGAFGKVGGILSDVLQPALNIVFGRSLEASTHVPFERPRIYGGGTANAHGGYHLACNLKKEELVDVALDAWDALRKH